MGSVTREQVLWLASGYLVCEAVTGSDTDSMVRELVGKGTQEQGHCSAR